MLRVHLKHIDSEYTPRDDYTFDLKVDADNKPVSNMVFFGLWGEFNNSANCYPILLRQDGQIDLGACEEDRLARYQETNIHNKRMVEGELVTVWETDSDTNRAEEYTLKKLPMSWLWDNSCVCRLAAKSSLRHGENRWFESSHGFRFPGVGKIDHPCPAMS
jgi:hypothetical protein